MRARSLAIGLAAALLAPATVPAQEVVPPSARTSLGLVVYGGFAQVRDTRRVVVPASGAVVWTGLPQTLDPATVVLLEGERSVAIDRQTFDAGRFAPDALLERAVGEPVVLLHPDGGRLDAVLVNPEGPVFRVGDELVLGWDGPVALPDERDGPTAARALRWRLDLAAGPRTLTATYLVDGVSWRADYVGVLTDETAMRLAGRVTVDNGTGAAWEDASLRLVAGDVRRQGGAPRPYAAEFAARATADAAGDVDRQAFADVHLYTVDGAFDLAPRATTQVPLFVETRVPVERAYVLEGRPWLYTVPPPGPPDAPEHPRIRLAFENEGVAGADAPLPAGTLHTYRPGPGGDLLFTGSAAIPHVPAGERVELETGSAFDLVAERTRTAFERIDPRTVETAWRIEIRNAGREAKTVRVVETIPGDWTILEESRPHERVDAATAVWEVPVPGEGSATLTWRARIVE